MQSEVICANQVLKSLSVAGGRAITTGQPGRPIRRLRQVVDRPLLKSYEDQATARLAARTDSLCPVCVRKARHEILDGKPGRVGL
jgi:hypothetical protein